MSEERILSIVETKMSEVFAEQHEALKEKLIELMAQQISKLIAKVETTEQEFMVYKEEHQANSTITIVENTAELEAMKYEHVKKTSALSENITTISNQLSQFRAAIDETNQKLKECNIRLVGVPESQNLNEDLKCDIVKFSKEQLDLHNIFIDDIEEATRLGKARDDKPRDVLVTFKTRQVRNKFYRQRKKLYDPSTMRSQTGIYINEDLPTYRQRLYFDARNLWKRTAIHSVWTSEGTIMVKMEESSVPTPVLSHRDLADLLRKRSDNLPDIDEEQKVIVY